MIIAFITENILKKEAYTIDSEAIICYCTYIHYGEQKKRINQTFEICYKEAHNRSSEETYQEKKNRETT